MLVAPSDHVIPDAAGLPRRGGRRRAAPPQAGRIVTFGIAPDRPETGYGYLELAEAPADAAPVARSRSSASSRSRDAARAEAMLAEGRFLWNAGIFLFRAGTLIHAVEGARARPDRAGRGARWPRREPDLGFLRLDPAPWARRARGLDRLRGDGEGRRTSRSCPTAGAGPTSAAGTRSGARRRATAPAWPLGGAATAIDCRNTLLRSEDDGLEVVGIGLDDIDRGGDARRGAGGRRRPRAGRQAGGRGAEGAERAAGRDLPEGPPPLGLVREPGDRRALPGEADRRASRRGAVAAVPPPPVRALDRGRRAPRRSRSTTR